MLSLHLHLPIPSLVSAFFLHNKQEKLSRVNMAAAVLSGAAFGAALAASAMYRPGLIVAQLRLEDFTMLRIFLTATLSGG